MFWLLITK